MKINAVYFGYSMYTDVFSSILPVYADVFSSIIPVLLAVSDNLHLSTVNFCQVPSRSTPDHDCCLTNSVWVSIWFATSGYSTPAPGDRHLCTHCSQLLAVYTLRLGEASSWCKQRHLSGFLLVETRLFACDLQMLWPCGQSQTDACGYQAGGLTQIAADGQRRVEYPSI